MESSRSPHCKVGKGKGGKGKGCEPPKPPHPIANPCDPSSFKLSFSQIGDNPVSIGQNNLGGQGPNIDDEEVLEFRNVGTANGAQINMEVSIAGGTYKARNSTRNGDNKRFGQINMNADYEADIQFCFVDSVDHNPILLPPFSLTFYDLGANSTRGRPVTFQLRHP